MTEIEAQDLKETTGKMISALRKHGDEYAAGYLESFIVGLIVKHVTDPIEVTMVKMRMLNIGINAILDAKN